MAMKFVSPRGFTNFDQYRESLVNVALEKFAVQYCRFDSYDERIEKGNKIQAERERAEEIAWEQWEYYVDMMEDCHERGIGPGWE